MYQLILLNDQGASARTHHKTKKEVYLQIRVWKANKMTARVIVDGQSIYDGRALGFKASPRGTSR